MSSASSMVDWDLAGRTARRLISSGPKTTRGGRRRRRPRTARGRRDRRRPRRGPDRDDARPRRPAARGAVVDRPGWVDANASGMAALLDPLVAKLAEKQDTRPGPLATAIGSRAPACRPAASSPSSPPACSASTRSSAPAAGCCWSRRTSSPPSRSSASTRRDFRLWVCLHEVTHQLQFTAVPWLKPHLESEIAEFVAATDLSADVLRERLQDVLRSLGDAIRGDDGDSEGLMALIQDPRQRAVLDRVTAVMSLVEGHAEFVMDGVGPDVVPTVKTLRKRFAQRRKGRGPAGPGDAPAARPRAEDEAVRRRPDVRRRRHRPRRHGGLQPRLGGAARTCP